MSEVSLAACAFCGRHGTVVIHGQVTECTGCGIVQIRPPDGDCARCGIAKSEHHVCSSCVCSTCPPECDEWVGVDE